MSKISAYYIFDPIFCQKVQDRCFHMKGLSHVFRGCINFGYIADILILAFQSGTTTYFIRHGNEKCTFASY